MKQFFAWSKLVGVLLALLGLSISVYMWTFLSGNPSPIDLIGPTLWNYPVLDWLVTMTLGGFGILAFVYAIAEQRTWKNFLFGLPMFGLNALELYTWWSMELGKGTDINVATILFSFVVLTNTCAAVIYLFRRFTLPTIETK